MMTFIGVFSVCILLSITISAWISHDIVNNKLEGLRVELKHVEKNVSKTLDIISQRKCEKKGEYTIDKP